MAAHRGELGLLGAMAKQLDRPLALLETLVHRLDLRCAQLREGNVVAILRATSPVSRSTAAPIDASFQLFAIARI